MLKLRHAKREQSKIRVALMGVSGSGKTYGALLLSKGLVGSLDKVAVIDSEHSSADLYAHLGNYSVLPIEPPFSPEKYISAIRLCEEAGMEVIIIDSISHQWEGEGGILDIHSAMMGNSFTNWNKLTPRHNKFINSMLQSRCHIIATMRSKQDYVISNLNGKMVPEKVGLKPIVREGTDYEFSIVLDINHKHNCIASKDRTGLFSDKPEFIISESTGIRIKKWCMEGVPEVNAPETKHIIQQLNTLSNGTTNLK